MKPFLERIDFDAKRPQNRPRRLVGKHSPRGLPGRANAIIRSPAGFAQIPGADRCGVRCYSKALIHRVNFGKCKRGCDAAASIGGVEPGAFAPFVYRLGRHPFTVERAVRFR